jgi:hypothetical protein
MTDASPDLFDKIDALLGKRAPDALLDKGLENEDFPVLTEVVDPVRETRSEPRDQDRRQTERRDIDRRLGDRRQEGRGVGDRRPSDGQPALPSDMGAEMERLLSALEQRLTDMFIRQQLRMEEAVRKAIRDELDTHREDQH